MAKTDATPTPKTGGSYVARGGSLERVAGPDPEAPEAAPQEQAEPPAVEKPSGSKKS